MRMVDIVIYEGNFLYYPELFKLVKSVPREHRQTIQFEAIDKYYKWNSKPSKTVRIIYQRPENEQEIEARLAEAEEQRRQNAEKELAEFKRLQEKWGVKQHD